MGDHVPIPASPLIRALLWVQWRSLLARVRGLRKQSPLLLLVLSAFSFGYLAVGYLMFYWGLTYLDALPIFGGLLSQRILFLIFGFFFVMLVFSNLIIGYSTLFRNRETQWLLSLPISHSNIYRWKFSESLWVSSWALVFLSAPMMVAFGHVHQVAPIFYPQVALLYAPFIILPALLGSWGILFLVRVLPRRGVKKILLFLALGLVALLIFGIKPISGNDATSEQEVVIFNRLLKHSRIGLNPFLPSAWFTRSVVAWGDGLMTQGFFYFSVLLSNALVGLLIGFAVVGPTFYRSWTSAVSTRVERFQLEAVAKRMREKRRSWLESGLNMVKLVSQPVRALVLKDIRLFWRDPTQWIQFMIFFGLLCIYVLNLRNMAFDFGSPFWETLISYLNLTASSLTLSTLTTRFVFPQFSLEGRRIWIIGLAPVGLRRVLLQKFWMSCIASSLVTVILMITSSLMLNLSWPKVGFFAISIGLMSATLSGLAVGLGALFPNFKEDNPSKVVSSFGGTLCLVISFVYIGLFVSLTALPDLRLVTKMTLPISDAAALTTALVISAAVMLIPMRLAGRKVEHLEI